MIPIESYLYSETNMNKTKQQVILSLGDFRQFFLFLEYCLRLQARFILFYLFKFVS